MKNKSICVLLTISILLTLIACGGKSTNQINNDSSQNVIIENASTDSNESIEALKVNGTMLTDLNNNPIQLKGISTHGIAWFPQYINKDCFEYLKDNFKINTIRLAMYTAENQGYCTGGNQEDLYELLCKGIEYATELNLYVIIDWHILSDSNPLTYTDSAKNFFEKISGDYSQYNNIIYEICNEPNGDTTWNDITDYANTIIPIIRANDSDSIILVGTPSWSQDIEKAVESPLDYENILYTMHFYAGTHKNSLRNSMKKALNNDTPIFVSEFGICDASGDGEINIKEANKWMDILNEYKVSYVMWNLSNKDETSSLLKNTCDKTSNFNENDFSESALWLKETIEKSYKQ